MKRSVFLTAIWLVCSGAGSAGAAEADWSQAGLERATARFAPVALTVDLAGLPPAERAALAKLVAAARVIDGIYLRQDAPNNTADLVSLAADRSALGRQRLDYFVLNKGPWSALDKDAPFLPGVGTKPGQGGYYPADATRADVEAWFKTLAPAESEKATGFFTTIRRTPTGGLGAVPYSREYQNELIAAARLLREAAALTAQPTLKSFLEQRATAFLDDDYYASDVAWMDLDASIEPTIGPYEVYGDNWFGYKAAFEAFVAVVDNAETAKLGRFSAELQGLEDRLPIEPRFRRAKLGAAAPIRVVNLVFSAGDGNHAVQTVAFNLPNDERVVAAKGSKRVLLRNVQAAKFTQVLAPIAAHVIAVADQPLVAFDPFFTHTLMHELMHGLGPQTITVDGRATTVRKELKDLNGLLEEAKADISGLWALQQLVDKGVLPKSEERSFYVTFVASIFRTLRFGATESLAKGMELQLNYLLDAGAVRIGADGRVGFDFAKTRTAVTGLTHDIMTIQATGDYPKAREWLSRMLVIRPDVQRLLDGLSDVPVDIRPEFVTAAQLDGG